jgi:hypothetical protein
VHRRADAFVLFEEQDVMAAPRQPCGGQRARRPGADDDNVARESSAQNFRPLASQVPRNVIQNDNRISRTSSHSD